MKRNTYLKIKLDNISYNINKLISTFDNYLYYFGVVKANCYGCGDITLIKNIINNGCNYLAVATLDEALYIRKEIKDNNHIKYVSNYLNTIPYEILKSIGYRVYRIYE